ncbi:MAG TPA: hypothetical protein PK156_38690, partial [Polyangium sp.]|nr:hypothetical protein [Polyangium sp.]
MKTHSAAIVVCIIAASCVADPDPGAGSGGGPGSGGNGSGNGPPTTVPEGDAFPAGAVSFFYRFACPYDWSAYQDAAGRVIVGANQG